MILLFSVLNGPNIPSLKEKKKDIGSIKSSDCVERRESSTSLSKSCEISNFIFIFTVMAKNIGTLGKLDHRRKFIFPLYNKNFKWG